MPGVIGPRPDIAGFAAAPDREGSESNTDLFAELLIPVFGGAADAQSLDLGLGYRYSDYNHAGGVSSYKTEFGRATEVIERHNFRRTIPAHQREAIDGEPDDVEHRANRDRVLSSGPRPRVPRHGGRLQLIADVTDRASLSAAIGR